MYLTKHNLVKIQTLYFLFLYSKSIEAKHWLGAGEIRRALGFESRRSIYTLLTRWTSWKMVKRFAYPYAYFIDRRGVRYLKSLPKWYLAYQEVWEATAIRVNLRFVWLAPDGAHVLKAPFSAASDYYFIPRRGKDLAISRPCLVIKVLSGREALLKVKRYGLFYSKELLAALIEQGHVQSQVEAV
jgi:hypothetical protein